MRVEPATRNGARAFIAAWHRHSPAPHGWLFGVRLVSEGGDTLAVACAGRPVSRNLQDGATVEITRVCAAPWSASSVNACSRLYGALCRAAKALGYRRAVTYTLATEPGVSLRAAGFAPVADVKAQQWARAARPRAQREAVARVRWERPL